MSNLDEEIKQALEENTNLSKEEYEALQRKADNQTANHGVQGKAPVSESVRHKRMQSNFYGINVKILMNVLASLDTMNEKLEEISKKMGDK